MNKKEEVVLSKRLSSILRHEAVRLKLPMSSDGYVDVEIILALPFLRSKGYKLHHIESVVRSNEKQRFQLDYHNDDDGMTASSGSTVINTSVVSSRKSLIRIRAVQGHTIKGVINDSELLKEICLDDVELPRYVFHGTYMEALTSICGQGLSRMRRNHIHLAVGLPAHLQHLFAVDCVSRNDAADTSENVSVSAGIKNEHDSKCSLTSDSPHVGDKPDSRGSGRRNVSTGTVLSGMRNSCTAAIVVDLVLAMREGVRFFRSSNNVILTRGVEDSGVLPPRYFAQVIRTRLSAESLARPSRPAQSAPAPSHSGEPIISGLVNEIPADGNTTGRNRQNRNERRRRRRPSTNGEIQTSASDGAVLQTVSPSSSHPPDIEKAGFSTQTSLRGSVDEKPLETTASQSTKRS